MTGIQIVRTLQADYGLGDDTILAILADYIDECCIPEHVFEFFLDHADPRIDEPEDGEPEEVILDDDEFDGE